MVLFIYKYIYKISKGLSTVNFYMYDLQYCVIINNNIQLVI